MSDIQDRVIIVTGAAGQLGRAYTSALLERKAKVAAIDCRAIDLNPNKNLKILSVDITNKSHLEAASNEIQEDWGSIDGLINNAGVDAPPDAPVEETGPFESYPEEAWDKVLNVNLKGIFLCKFFSILP